MSYFFRALFYAAWLIGKPFGGIRPRRIYNYLGRRAFLAPEFRWRRNRWGSELRLAPYYHIDRDIILFGCYDADLHRALEALVKPGMVCMDVGANLGEMALHMATKTGSGGKVYAFEPVSVVFSRLCEHVERNGAGAIVSPIQVALSNENGAVEIAFANADEDNQGLGSIINVDNMSVPLRETVVTQTVDDFAREHGIERIDLMKVDIQGAEYFLLEGGRYVFGKIGPDLLMEISPDDLQKAGKNSRDLCQKIESYGYTIFKMNGGRPGERIHASETPIDFHAINVYCTKSAKGGRE